MARRLSQAAIMYHKDTLNGQLQIHGKVQTTELIKYEQTFKVIMRKSLEFFTCTVHEAELGVPYSEASEKCSLHML